jgi:hypothetical protein
MPLTYRLSPDEGILFVRADGVITQPERLDAMRAWMSDPAFGRCLDTFCDFSAAESTPRLSDLRELVEVMGQSLPRTEPRRVAILTSKPITFGVARVFGDLVQLDAVPLQVKVFFDRDVAWAWLRPHEPVRGPA